MTDEPAGPPQSSGFVPLPNQPFDISAAPRTRPAQPGQSPPPAPVPSAQPTPEAPAPVPQGPPKDHADRAVLCPYCASEVTNAERCDACRGSLDPLSRQASQNTMGPWALLDPERPGMPGMSFGTLRRLVERGRVSRDSVVRGPTTRQFWVRADHAPGVAVLLGVCHACKADAAPTLTVCTACQAELHVAPDDRQHLGLIEARDLPGTAPVRSAATLAQDAPSAARLDADSARRRTRILGALCVLLVIGIFVVSGLWMWDSLDERGVKIDLPGVTRTTPQQNPPNTAGPSVTTPANTGGSTTPVIADPIEVAPPTTAPIDPALVALDAGLEEWHPDLRRAYELEEEGTLASVERAVQLVEGVLREAGDASAFPLISAWLERLRERADRLFAESVLGD